MLYSTHAFLNNKERLGMIKFLLKLVGAAFIVLWWIVAGFFKKILDIFKLVARIKKIFVDKKENREGEDNL